MTSGPPAEVPEPTSPELVLVAPLEDAQLERDRLPDQPLRPPPPRPAGPRRPRARKRSWRRRVLLLAVAAVVAGAALAFAPSGSNRAAPIEWRSLDGSRNNLAHPHWGQTGREYLRVAKPSYADGIAAMVRGPDARYISNRVFNDIGQNVVSETGVSQWGWVWGQFLDHTFGLRNERRGESASILFREDDPTEAFRNDLGAIDFARTPAAPGTGRSTPRQQINTVSSYIDAFAVYGATRSRLEWLRAGPVDGNMANNDASLLLPDGYLPRADARGKPAKAPPMDLMGALAADPSNAVVAGDVRANENIALTAVHTLFAREHNRIVSQLPETLSSEERFQIARRVVGAEQQYITYHEFLPALGVVLPPYAGYDPTVNPTLSNEFATVGYRVHSMVHGELEPKAPDGTYRPGQLKALTGTGIEAEPEEGAVVLVIPLGVAYGNPDLLQAVGLGPLLEGLGAERQYRNDEQIDDSMRSILFQIPKPGTRNPSVCGEPFVNPKCFSDVLDLGAIDVERGRDHGMPSYNQLRVAYGLAPKTSYTGITGESTDRFPSNSLVAGPDPIDDPRSLDFTKLQDANGHRLKPRTDEAQAETILATRRTTLAARLRAIYGPGNVDKVDAFVGMVSEPHVRGTEFGELQLAMWAKQFQALRDGDRFFYLNDPVLDRIRRKYGIDYRNTLADVIRMNTSVTTQADVFKAPLSE
jgi:hypothetical protein